jgi:Divergent InlB B-repeat domain
MSSRSKVPLQFGLLAVVVAVALGGGAVARAALGPPSLPCQLLNYECVTVVVPVYTADGFSPGNGHVTTSPAGIDCTITEGTQSGECTHTFLEPCSGSCDTPAQHITLDISLDAGEGSWITIPALGHPAHAGTGSQFHMTQSNPTFNLFGPPYGFVLAKLNLKVAAQGLGGGRVTGGTIDCGSSCAAQVDYGAPVTLTAISYAGSVLEGWTGACAGQGDTCSLTPTSDITTAAVFGHAPNPTPSPAPVPPAPSPPGPTAPAGTAQLDGDLVAAKTARSKLKARIVLVELRLGESASGTLSLMRGTKTIATKQVSNLAAGDRVITLVVPPGARKGAALLKVDLANAAGAKASWSRPLKIPK